MVPIKIAHGFTMFHSCSFFLNCGDALMGWAPPCFPRSGSQSHWHSLAYVAFSSITRPVFQPFNCIPMFRIIFCCFIFITHVVAQSPGCTQAFQVHVECVTSKCFASDVHSFMRSSKQCGQALTSRSPPPQSSALSTATPSQRSSLKSSVVFGCLVGGIAIGMICGVAVLIFIQNQHKTAKFLGIDDIILPVPLTTAKPEDDFELSP